MTTLGKIMGALLGWLIAGPFGMFIGVFIGHQFDAGLKMHLGRVMPGYDPLKTRQGFFKITFQVMGHVAKSDGVVSKDEIRAAKAIMQRMRLSEAQKRQAIRYFNEGKQASFHLQAALHELNTLCNRQQALLQLFVEMQHQAARADGQLGAKKTAILQQISQKFGMNSVYSRQYDDMFSTERPRAGQRRQQGARDERFRRPRATSTAKPLTLAYQRLNVAESASPKEIKRAYRRMMSQHHPDKLISKGLPEEMIRLATDKTQQIQKAYEQIREARGF